METTKRHVFFGAMNRLRKFPHHMRIEGALPFTETMILMNIKRAQDHEDAKFNVKKIQKFLNISQSAVSQTIAGLEEKGMISREIDASDRRKFALTLTPLGQETIDTMTARMDALFDEVFESVSDEEIEAFDAFTLKLVAQAEKVIAKYHENCEDKE